LPIDDDWLTPNADPLPFDCAKLVKDCWKRLVLSNSFSFDLENIPPPLLKFLDFEDKPDLLAFKLMSDLETFSLFSDYLLAGGLLWPESSSLRNSLLMARQDLEFFTLSSLLGLD
jgi:hypothetical protein